MYESLVDEVMNGLTDDDAFDLALPVGQDEYAWNVYRRPPTPNKQQWILLLRTDGEVLTRVEADAKDVQLRNYWRDRLIVSTLGSLWVYRFKKVGEKWTKDRCTMIDFAKLKAGARDSISSC